MNYTDFYEANNVYYSIPFVSANYLTGISFQSVDDNIYKTKIDWNDGNTSNISANSTVINKNYPSLSSGRLKIYNNPKKIVSINFNLGASNYNSTTGLGTSRSVEITPSILDYFPNCESFYFNHYSAGSTDPAIQGKVTGEWSLKCNDKLKVLNLYDIDYIGSSATFNLDTIPSNSIIETLILGYAGVPTNGNVIVNGSITNLPSTCKILYLGADRAGTSNSVSGIVPSTLEEIYRVGRNTITGNINNFNPNLRFLNIQGSNTITGNLTTFSSINTLILTGQNTITGSLSNIISVVSLNVQGSNKINGIFPNLTECVTCVIQGNNELTGSVPVMDKMITFTIQGNNTLGGLISLPNATSVNIGGVNIISDLLLPKANSISISGNNTISGDISSKIKSDIDSLVISGSNTVSNIGNPSVARTISILGNNIISGDILNKITNASRIELTGNNTINTYSQRSFPANMTVFNLAGNNTLTTTMVDQLLIDMSATSWTGSNPRITIRGNSQPPSSASSAARTSLSNRGITLSLNS